jgi:multiple sugar transport system ATP-binding protein
MTMGNRIVIMKDGFIQQVDSPQNIYSCPDNLFVAGFIGSPAMNLIDGRLIKLADIFYVEFNGCDTNINHQIIHRIPLPAEKYNGHTLDKYVNKEIVMGIRPEDVHDEPRLLENYATCRFNVNVEVRESMGAETFLHVNTGGINIIARVAPSSSACPGDNIEIALSNDKIHLFDKKTEKTICN